MAKVKNISGDDRTVAELGGRWVDVDVVVEVPDGEAVRYVSQGLEPGSGPGQVGSVWAPADDVSQAALDEFLTPPPVEEEPEQGEGSED